MGQTAVGNVVVVVGEDTGMSEGLLHRDSTFRGLVTVPCKDLLRGSSLQRWPWMSSPPEALPRVQLM